MDEKYKVTRVRPVDMFPQINVENVVLLEEDKISDLRIVIFEFEF
jgi:23S rRNA (uracil1939-C5)-methyltransferase